MKLLLNFQNEKINILNLLDFDLWELMYVLNTDIIQSYTCIHRTETTLEYIFQFEPISFFPAFYTHMMVSKENNNYSIKTIESSIKNCVQILTKNECILVSGTEHNVDVHVEFDLCSDNDIINNFIEKRFIKIYSRIKEHIQSI
jgi:hypothetical protein